MDSNKNLGDRAAIYVVLKKYNWEPKVNRTGQTSINHEDTPTNTHEKIYAISTL